MPTLKLLGDRIITPGSRKLVAITTAKTCPPPIQGDRWARNSQHPNAQLVNLMDESANYAAVYRTKEYFRGVGRIGSGGVISAFGAGSRARWRFAFHTGKYAHGACVIAGLVPGGTNVNAKARLDIANGAGVVVASQELVFGASPVGTGGTTAGWQHLKQIQSYIDGLSPDTDYYGTFYDVDYGRLQSATVFELASLTENFSGYLPQNLTTGSAVLDCYREYLATLLNDLLQNSGALLTSFSVDDGTAPASRSSAVSANLLDGSSTAVSASTPGFTWDMRNRDRVSQVTGVPCVMKVYGNASPGGGGAVSLKNSAGVTIATLAAWAPGAAAWQSVAFNMPATLDKYDLHWNGNGAANLNVYAVTVYEKG